MIRILSLLWLLVQVLALAISGLAAFGLLVLWGFGLASRMQGERPYNGEFAQFSVLAWVLAGGYVVALWVWWPYAKEIMHAKK